MIEDGFNDDNANFYLETIKNHFFYVEKYKSVKNFKSKLQDGQSLSKSIKLLYQKPTIVSVNKDC